MRIHELSFENTGQWPIAIKFGFLSGLWILIIVLGYLFVLQMDFERYTSLKLQEETLKIEFASKGYQARLLNAYKTKLQGIKKDFGKRLKAFPKKNEMPVLLDDISKTGIQAGLKVTLFVPQKELAHDFFMELPLKISLKGTYFQLLQFLMDVAQMNRIVTFHDFRIEVASSIDEDSKSQNALEMTLRAKTYCYQKR